MNKHTRIDIFIFMLRCSLLCFWGFMFDVLGVNGIAAASEDLSLTKAEKLALNKFRTRMFPILPHSYQRTDLYLVRWLRAQNLDMKAAEKMLKSNLRWRQNEEIDRIHQEDWSDLLENYPYTNSTFDRAGRPIMTARAGVWNFRAKALSSSRGRFVRYFAKIFDEGRQRVIEEQKKGNTVTRWTLLVNLEGFSLVQSACSACLSLYLSFLEIYEERFPMELNQCIIINTPQIFKIVMDLITPTMTPETRRLIILLGTDRKEWTKELDPIISKKERTPEYGGSLRVN